MFTIIFLSAAFLLVAFTSFVIIAGVLFGGSNEGRVEEKLFGE